MADTAVTITAGTGTNIDTRTEATNGHHRQVVVLGDPAINAGVAPVDATAGLKVDLGADNDITGTVTANLSATDNAVLDSIDAAVNGTLTVGSHAVTNAGTFATQVTSLPSSTNTIEVVGDAAENAAAAGNPVLTGGRYDLTPRTLGDGDVGAIALDPDGAVQISDGGNSITVDGSLTVDLGANNDVTVTNATAANLKVDGSDVTQPISAASLPLPSGASTAAKQPALGTAGTASSDVITVQGIASMTALKVDGSAVTQPVSGTFWQATQPVSGTVSITSNSAVNVAQINGVATTMGNGASGTGVQRVTLASDSTGNIATIGTSVTPGTAAANLGKAEDAAHSSGDVGVMSLGVRASSPTERSAGPTDGDYEPFATNERGAVWVTPIPSANGGDSVMNATSEDGSTALTSTAQVIKATAGTLTGYYIYNPNSSATYVHFYNTAAASVTVGTTNPLFGVCIPATSAANLSGLNVKFSNAGWSWAATTTGGGNTAPTTALEAVAFYI